ncbi:MAG: hypothetical protein JWN48_1021 [Myxococcaceae bacterium]|nr:hypothetical protein [Myxococcaceae bacterium]
MTNVQARLCLLLLSVAACSHAASPSTPTLGTKAPGATSAAVCGEGKAVPFNDAAGTGGAFSKLFGTHYAELVFTCPSDESCSLPEDNQVELTVEPLGEVACEFASCRNPYVARLPFSHDPNPSCANLLWARVKLHLKTDAGTLDEHEAAVNVLASPRGESFIRFMIEHGSSFQSAPTSAETRALLLDVQVELASERLRGQLSALAAPMPSEPANELHFSALWTATWETQIAPSR